MCVLVGVVFASLFGMLRSVNRKAPKNNNYWL
jgi:hypothetical protein